MKQQEEYVQNMEMIINETTNQIIKSFDYEDPEASRERIHEIISLTIGMAMIHGATEMTRMINSSNNDSLAHPN